MDDHGVDTALTQVVRRFVAQQVAPYASHWDEAAQFPAATFAALEGLGLAQGTRAQLVLATIELAAADAGLALAFAAHAAAESVLGEGGAWIEAGMSRCVPLGQTATRFVVETPTGLGVMNRADLHIVPSIEPLGLRSAGCADVVLDNGVAVPIAGSSIWGTLVAAVGVGLGQAALAAAGAYALQRQQFGRSISSFQAIQWKLADAATVLAAARALTQFGDGAKAVMLSVEAAMVCANHALQIHGGNGISRQYPVERYYRDAQALSSGLKFLRKRNVARGVLGEVGFVG